MATTGGSQRQNEIEKKIDELRREIIKEDRVEKVQGPDPWPQPPNKDTEQDPDI